MTGKNGKLAMYISLLFVLATGIFLTADALFINGLSYDYNKIGMQWLDPYFSHLYAGVAFILMSLYALYRGNK